MKRIELGRRTSDAGEKLVFFAEGENILVRRQAGNIHFYCPLDEWEMSAARRCQTFEPANAKGATTD